MNFGIMDVKFVFASDLTYLMDGVESVKKDGWGAYGTPIVGILPLNKGYGMMQMVVKDRSNS